MKNPAGWWRNLAARLLLLRDKPERLSRGVALGVLMNFLPTFGFGTFIAFFLAPFLGANAPAAALGALAFKWAFPFFYLANLLVGSRMAGVPFQAPRAVDVSVLGELTAAFVAGSLVNGAAAFLLVDRAMLYTLNFLRRLRKD